MRKFGLHFGLILACVVVLLPPLWALRTSFVPESMSYSTEILPAFTLDNYAGLFAKNRFGTFYVNSLIVALGSVIVALPFAACTGYAFARFRTGGRFARFVVLATQMLPPVALVLPAFALLRGAGLTNSLPGLILGWRHRLGRLLADRHPDLAAGPCRRRRARLHSVVERVPVRPRVERAADRHDPGFAGCLADIEWRADRQGFGGCGAGHPAARDRVAFHPALHHSGIDVRRCQISRKAPTTGTMRR